jgi:hypothetical protein
MDDDEYSRYYDPVDPETQAAAHIIKQDLASVSNDDWLPFMTALFERQRDLGEKAVRNQEVVPEPAVPRPPGAPAPTGEVLRGAFDYVSYIPPWTDPDYREDRALHHGDFVYVHRPERDVLSRLRPALRPEDAPRNPTPYALRWGINPDRKDGRSRLSPTNAVSRKFLPALQAQLADVSVVDKVAMEDETGRRKDIPILENLGRPAIGLQVFEDYKKSKGMPSLAEIFQAPFFQRDISELKPEDVTASTLQYIQSLQESVEDDRDFQRQFFGGWTTDELIEQKIHTMSDETESDLDLNRPLHP